MKEVYGAPSHCEDERANERIPWSGRVRVLEEFGPVELDGVELGRTSLVVRGTWCVARGRAVTIELRFEDEPVQVLTTVAAVAYADGLVVLRLDIEASSPRGNDRIAAAARRSFHELPTSPEIAA
jgi:hypothetical protein